MSLNKPKVWLKLASAAVVASGLASLISSENVATRFLSLNEHFNDLLVTSLPAPKPSSDLLAVGVRVSDAPSFYTKRSLEDLKPVIADIMVSNPKVAIATFLPTNQDKHLREFISFTRQFPNLYFLTDYEEFDSQSPQHDPILKNLNWIFIPLTRDTSAPPFDQKTRRLIVNFTLNASNDQTALNMLKKYGIERAPTDYQTFKFFNSNQTYFRHRGPTAYLTPTYQDFRKNPASGKDKIIVFGTSEHSYEKPPFRAMSIYTGKTLTGYERLALNLDTLILKDEVSRTKNSVRSVVAFAFFFVYIAGLFLLGPIRSSVFGFTLLALWVVCTTVPYVFADQFLYLTEVAVSIAAIHFFASPALLIRYLRAKDREAAEREIAIKTARAEMGLKIATQVAHDIRSPLGAIQIASKMSDSKREEAKELLHTSIDRLNRIANDLLTQFRSGQFSLKPVQQIHVVPFMQNLAKSLRLTHPEIDVRITGDENALIQINNGTDLERALANLFNNSIEAMGAKGDIEVAIATDAEHCTIEIGDSGPGVPEEIRAHLFERGFTFGKARGSGLGLAQVKETLEKLGGSITLVPSTKGAHFKMVLPKIS